MFPPSEVSRFDAATFKLGASHIDAAPGEPVLRLTAMLDVYGPVRAALDVASAG